LVDIKNLDLSRCDFLRHVEVNSHSIIRALPDHPFRDFISIIPSPQLKTCLIMSYDNDLDKLKQTLLASPKPAVKSAMQKEQEGNPKRDVQITFGLDIEKDEAETHRTALEVALACAVGDGVFEFLMSAPALEVYPRVWDQAA
jgi:hypothetical protein